MKNNTVKTLGELELRELVDLGLRMPDGSTELFEVVNIADDCVAVMTKNIIDFMPFNDEDNKHSGKANSYIKSSVRKYLVELYQTVINENAGLDKYNYGLKEFYLPSANAMGFDTEKGWQAFKDDASRVKYTGTFASTKDEAYGLSKADWYWTSTPNATDATHVRHVGTLGTLGNYYVYLGRNGVSPALDLKSSSPVILIDGVWCLTEEKTSNEDLNVDIKIGDWVEVTHTVGVDVQEGILLGDCFEVTSVKAGGNLVVKLPSTEIWYLLPDQVRKIEPPLSYYKKSKETADFNERLKGYYQHTAIETLKVYHTAHKVKEERIEALNKALENIQELIKLEKKSD